MSINTRSESQPEEKQPEEVKHETQGSGEQQYEYQKKNKSELFEDGHSFNFDGKQSKKQFRSIQRRYGY